MKFWVMGSTAPINSTMQKQPSCKKGEAKNVQVSDFGTKDSYMTV